MIKIETIDRIIKNDTSTLTKEVVDKIIENLEKNREQYLYAIDFLNDTNCMRKNTKQYKERKRIIDLNQETFDNVIQLDKKIFGNSSNVKLSIKNFISMTYDEITNDILLKKYISKPSKFDFRWQLMDEICQYSAAAKKDFPKKSLWSLIFNYDEISNKPINSISVRNHLMNLVNIDVCPYCNRLYITKWKNSIGKYKSTADLDHFFIKKSYPIFALSFFNFIPSCGVCNSRMKGDRFLSKDKHHTPPLYPGKAGFDSDAYFDISESAEDILNLIFKKEDIDIKFEVNSQNYEKEINQSIELFHLKEVYASHQEYIREVLLKKYAYDNDDYTDTLRCLINVINKTKNEKEGTDLKIYEREDILNESLKKEIQEFLYGYKWDDENCDANRPLSKLTYDILNR